MSYTNQSWRMAITKLLEMTSKNEIKWEISDLYGGDAWTTVDGSFSASQADKVYVISKTRSRYYIDENEFVWQGGYNFSIFENKGFHGYEHIATAPSMNSLNALYDAAEGNLAFNRNALGGLLG